MKTWSRAVLSFVTLSLMTGCSGYRAAVIPGTFDLAQPPDGDAPVVAEGMVAKIYLVSGEVLQGEVVRIESEEITIGRVGNYGVEETVVAMNDIDRVEVEASSKAASAAVGVVGGITIALSGIVVLFLLFADVGPLG